MAIFFATLVAYRKKKKVPCNLGSSTMVGAASVHTALTSGFGDIIQYPPWKGGKEFVSPEALIPTPCTHDTSAVHFPLSRYYRLSALFDHSLYLPLQLESHCIILASWSVI